MCNCNKNIQGNKLQGTFEDILSTSANLDSIFPVNESTGQRALNLNIQFDLKSAAYIFAIGLVLGVIIKKM